VTAAGALMKGSDRREMSPVHVEMIASMERRGRRVDHLPKGATVRAENSPRRPEIRTFARRSRNQNGAERKLDLDRVKLISDVLAAWVGVVALLAGGIFGIQQYLAQEEGDRVKETLNFLDRYHKEPFVSARMALYKTWDKYTAKENSFRLGQVFDEKGFSSFIRETIKEENLTASVDLVTDFYSALEVCITAHACDQDLALLLFHADATAHFNRHFPYIDWARTDQNDPNVGKRLEEFKRRKIPD
jgi:hypothetical protein